MPAALEFPKIVPLESGDHLPREEFHRRYVAMPHLKKAELIAGVVYMPSPVSSLHARAHQTVVTWLGAYAARHSAVEALDNATAILDESNEVQPDACLRLLQGGTSRINDQGFVEGAPELVVEVALSSASIDLREKKAAYLRAGVREYIVWLILSKEVHWWRNVHGTFAPLPADNDGIIASQTMPGLRLNVTALLAGEVQAVLASLS